MNAKEEFLKTIEGLTVIAADIQYCSDGGYFGSPCTDIYLKANHTFKDVQTFLSQLDFEYNNGYGTQHRFGTIWFLEDCWAERDEYDGSEGWAIFSRPELPDHLK